MSKAFETVGAMTYDNLIYDDKMPIDTKTVSIRAGQGKLTRGTLLCKSTGTAGDSKFVKLGTAAVANETLTVDSILADDVDATSSVVGEAYRSGHFNRNALVGTLTESVETTLRNAGIYLSNKA